MESENIHILSTRLLNEAVTAKANDMNIEVDSVSFINVQPIVSVALKDQLQQLALQPLCAIFTSANAVTAVAGQINDIANWKIFCTGGKTKEHVAIAFGEDAVIASAKNAGLLAERIIASGKAVKVTFFCGDQRLDDLPEKLISNHIQTDEVIVYTTVQTPVFIEKNYHGILFFSPSAAHSFFSMNTVPIQTVLFSIGQTTTAVIKTYCTNRIITSEWPGTENILKLVTDFYKDASQEAH